MEVINIYNKKIEKIESLDKDNIYLNCKVEFFEDCNYKNIKVNMNKDVLDLDDNNRIVGTLKSYDIVIVNKTKKSWRKFIYFCFYILTFVNTLLALLSSLGEKNTTISIFNNIKYSVNLILFSISLLSIIFFAINYTKDLKIDFKRYFRFIRFNSYILSIFFILYNIFFYKYSLFIGNKACIYILCNLFLTLCWSIKE